MPRAVALCIVIARLALITLNFVDIVTIPRESL